MGQPRMMQIPNDTDHTKFKVSGSEKQPQFKLNFANDLWAVLNSVHVPRLSASR